MNKDLIQGEFINLQGHILLKSEIIGFSPLELFSLEQFNDGWKYRFNIITKSNIVKVLLESKDNDKEILEKIRLECIKKWKSSVNQTQNYKEIAERHGFNIWSSNGNAGFPGNNPSARIESIYVGYLNMDYILASSEDEAVKVAYDFIMSELIKNDFIHNYQQDKTYAQKMFVKYMKGRSK